jgi:adenylosuccinate synthase
VLDSEQFCYHPYIPSKEREKVNLAIVGAQWGDEGKGKIVDLLSTGFAIVARSQGGHNAGHTVFVRNRKFVLHLIPSGILHPDVSCVIGNGVVVDPQALFSEIEELNKQGIETAGRLFISEKAHVILPYHRELELLAEARLGKRQIGTTSRGIGPSYEDKIGRRGIRIGDLADSSSDGLLAQAVRDNVSMRNRLVSGSSVDWKQLHSDLCAAWPQLLPLVTDTSLYLHNASSEGRQILFEGAQGAMLDIDHGTYPFVSSSNSTIGGVCTGLGVSPKMIDGVLGVAKAYTTRVGEGPLPTELIGREGDELREIGKEYGASTGRPRRCGWYDSVSARYAVRINGFNELALTKLDVLDELEEVKICTAYRIGGRKVSEFSADASFLGTCTPEYESLPGWHRPTAGTREFEDLPREAKNYIRRIEELSNVPVAIVSTGSDREDTIVRKQSFVENWLT